MRISIPSIPHEILFAPPALDKITVVDAVLRVSAFISSGKTTLLTGAGVSVDSGIRAYRGHDGRYMNPNYKPIFYHELVDESPKGAAFRQRYWLRSYLGYLPVNNALPNTTHYALAALQHASIIPNIITQNVDGLHHKALALSKFSPMQVQSAILELHGTLHRVRCKYGHLVDRAEFQDSLTSANPQWKSFLDDVQLTGNEPRTNPDGDVEQLGISYEDFVVPDCPTCLHQNQKNNIHKPEVIFFGESIPTEVKERSFKDVENGDRLLLMGTTLATYSAYRLVKHALELKKPVLMINVGPTRADGLPGVEKINIPTGAIIRDVARGVLGNSAIDDPIIREMLNSGVVMPPPADDDDRAPRAVG
ncbi:DHS-like NAD/FAD-binding domain-containing protein [Hymenopellis radicata]|nr:DHS-like NAD/FAD-binding domain-containing protein [Hymenopellis radicata]